MRSAAEALLDMYEVKPPTKVVQGVMTCLLHTLTRTHNLTEAIKDLDQLSGLESNVDEVSYIKSVTQIAEMVGLHSTPTALKLAIELYPFVVNTERHQVVELGYEDITRITSRTRKDHRYLELKKALGAINSLDLGYKVLQKAKSGNDKEFIILKYKSREDLLKNLKENKLMSPNILDKVL